MEESELMGDLVDMEEFFDEPAEATKAPEPEKPEEKEPSDKERLVVMLTKLGLPLGVLDDWKKRFGSIYVFAPSQDDMYVWRPLFKKEWDQINQMMSKQEQGPEQAAQTSDRLARTVVKHCVLFPKLDPVGMSQARAGLIDTLFEVIMRGSYFLSPQEAMSLVIEL